ncbi:MAG: hypothetical protein AAFS07_11855 [Pseudomonadota bacterium]
MARHGGPGVEERQEAERRDASSDLRANQKHSARMQERFGRGVQLKTGQPDEGPNWFLFLGYVAAILFGIVLVLTL